MPGGGECRNEGIGAHFVLVAFELFVVHAFKRVGKLLFGRSGEAFLLRQKSYEHAVVIYYQLGKILVDDIDSDEVYKAVVLFFFVSNAGSGNIIDKETDIFTGVRLVLAVVAFFIRLLYVRHEFGRGHAHIRRW